MLAATGVPHVTTEVLQIDWIYELQSNTGFRKDDVYQGYLIPKGTICLPNVWYLSLFAPAEQCLMVQL